MLLVLIFFLKKINKAIDKQRQQPIPNATNRSGPIPNTTNRSTNNLTLPNSSNNNSDDKQHDKQQHANKPSQPKLHAILSDNAKHDISRDPERHGTTDVERAALRADAAGVRVRARLVRVGVSGRELSPADYNERVLLRARHQVLPPG